MFGPHLTLDLYSCDKKRIGDKKFIEKFLDKFPSIIGMHKISKPFVIYYKGKKNSFDKGGVSGFVLIAESHISIHTFVEQGFASIDLFSCKDFDIEKAKKFVIKSFKPKRIEEKFFSRGKYFQKNQNI